LPLRVPLAAALDMPASTRSRITGMYKNKVYFNTSNAMSA
jgi:hypothetical protein